MSDVKIWHNPRCSKSREAVKILKEAGIDTEVIKYLENTPDINELKDTLKMLGISPRELMRTKEDVYKALNLKEENDEEKLIQAMVENPKLIERPILFKKGKAIIGRPSSLILPWLS